MMMSSSASGGRHQAAPNGRICTGLVKRNQAEAVKAAVPAPAFKSKQEELQEHPGSKNPQQQQQQHPECSMCGDVGFPTELFKCKKCLRRYQHTYCSRFYPHTVDQDTCEWCCLSGDRSSNNPSNCSTGSSNNNTHMFNHSTSVVPCKGPPPTSQLKQLPGKRKQQQQQQQPDAPNRSSINGLSRTQYADALELLLEVAQTASEVGKGSKPMAKKQRTEQVVEDSSTSSSGVAAQQQQQQQRGNPKKMVSSASKLHFSSTSRIRYKLLSDVLC